MLGFRCTEGCSSNGLGIRLDRRSGRTISEGVGMLDNLLVMLIIDGLVSSSFLKDDSVGVKTGGRLFGERAPFSTERGRETLRAAGGSFLLPLNIVLLDVGVSGAGGGGSCMVGYRLLEGEGPFKLGLGNEWFLGDLFGTPKVE